MNEKELMFWLLLLALVLALSDCVWEFMKLVKVSKAKASTPKMVDVGRITIYMRLTGYEQPITKEFVGEVRRGVWTALRGSKWPPIKRATCVAMEWLQSDEPFLEIEEGTLIRGNEIAAIKFGSEVEHLVERK